MQYLHHGIFCLLCAYTNLPPPCGSSCITILYACNINIPGGCITLCLRNGPSSVWQLLHKLTLCLRHRLDAARVATGAAAPPATAVPVLAAAAVALQQNDEHLRKVPYHPPVPISLARSSRAPFSPHSWAGASTPIHPMTASNAFPTSWPSPLIK